MSEADQTTKPLLLITGAAGNLGRSLTEAFADEFRVVGLDRSAGSDGPEIVEIDITDPQSVEAALAEIAEDHGRTIAAVIHLIAFFDFTGEDNPLYEEVNVEGTRNLLHALAAFEVERFVYASTILVHRPAEPGERIDEETPLDPRWAYPESKKAAEDVIRTEASMPYAILRLAGIYDEESSVPTLAHQIARIHERRMKSHLYAGPLDVGQSMLHRDDMIDAIKRTVERRRELPRRTELLIGEPEAIGYGDLQDRIGELLHGTEDWRTIRIPAPVAKAGAFVEDKLEPLIPDAIDGGEEPFIKPFMIDMAGDHYALDVSKARELLGWRPRHRLEDELPAMIARLKRDPAAWYEANGMTPPD